jgi:1-acyl-sn-glycerol-3-phosphate acyltransferase
MFRLFSLLMFKLNNWQIDPNSIPLDQYKKFILVGAPHTSNWDVIYFLATIHHLKIKPRFLIKTEWMRFPFNLIFEPLGGLEIDRTPAQSKETKISMVSIMIDLFKNNNELIITISPEGTRSYNPNWKKGFYHTALEAEVPIMISYLDYKNKTAGISRAFIPTGNIDKDLTEISDLYAAYTGKNQELFAPYQHSSE